MLSLVPPLTVFILFDTGDRGTPGPPGTKGDHGERGLRGPAGVSRKNVIFIMHRINNNTVPITAATEFICGKDDCEPFFFFQNEMKMNPKQKEPHIFFIIS